LTAWLILPCFVFSSLGCTIVGAGIGNEIPRRGDVEVPADIRALPKGMDVTVVYRGPEKAEGASLLTIEGVYRGTDEDRAVVERGFQSYSIPLSRIEQTRARPPNGAYSLEGGLIGLGLDLAAVAGLYLMAARCCPR
jgi:hypothetical protein